jgi:sugar phosphate isomerase/epimerase
LLQAQIAVQLYTLREVATRDPEGMLARLGAIGFVAVESAGLFGRRPEAVAAMLADAGLTLCSAHVGLTDDDTYEADLEAHQTAGASTFIIPALPPEGFTDLDAVQRTAESIGKANQRVRSRGGQLGYHNHHWEMKPIDGRPALLHLFEHLDPTVLAEVDVYWARVGGADPARVVADLGDRVRMLHVKDGPADHPDSAMVAVGDGSIEMTPILTANPAVAWHIVELDRCDTDMFEAVERSYHFLVDRGLSQGRL